MIWWFQYFSQASVSLISNRTVKRGFPVFTESTLGLPLADWGETWPLGVGGWAGPCNRPAAEPILGRGGTPGSGATDARRALGGGLRLIAEGETEPGASGQRPA